MRKGARLAFLAAEGALYAVFLARDLCNAGGTTAVKAAAILMVAFAGLFAGKGREDRLVTAALLLTVCADVFLLVLDRCYAAGVLLFCAVQLLYTLRLSPEHTGRAVMLRLLPAALAAGIGAKWGAMTALPAYYIVWFAGNLAAAWRKAWTQKTGESFCFAFGMLLFFCCDICVGLHNLPPQLLSAGVREFAQDAMWAFYLPGQIGILSSTHVWKGETR